MSIMKKNIAKRNSHHQTKPKQFKLTYSSLEKIWDLSSVDWVTVRQKRSKRYENQKYVSFLKALIESDYSL